MKSPILFVVFNRPDSTSRVFSAIRKAKPPRLYIAADGPRTSSSDDLELCARARAAATAVDWPCEVHTLFRDTNIGCKLGMSGAISWFFENECEGIVLEDDVIPLETFFDYCDELLDRYRSDPRVAVISGSNLIADRYSPPASYFFSRYNHVWGWASWRRAWRDYDVSMAEWPEWRDAGGLNHTFPSSWQSRAYWRLVLDSAFKGEIDAWSYAWIFSCWKNRRLTAIPSLNQTRNVGFGVGATHTTGGEPDSVRSCIPMELPWPLSHPPEVAQDEIADRLMDRHAFRISPISVLAKLIRRAIRAGR